MLTTGFDHLQDSVLRSAHFPEAVKVLRIDRVDGTFYTLHAVGTQTGKHYSPILTQQELEMMSRDVRGKSILDGSAASFRLAIEAYRIRLAHLYDPLFAVSVSKIDPLPHQLEAVYEYMLPQPALRFMLADDPGAGKTIMGGLLLKELKLRGVLTRTLIVVPSPLRTQWQREMREKFGEHFDIVERATLNALGSARTWGLTHQAIVSIDFVKQPDVLDSLAVAEMWDLIIVDEAHKMAAYRRSPTKVERSQRYRLGEVLSERAERLLLMTATPHKGDPENFRFLLGLVDPDLFADQQTLQRAVERHENPIFLRRLKEDMRRFDGRPLFPPRHARTITYELAGAEWDLYRRVTHYVETNFNRALADENRNVTFALIVLQRRLASSVRAIRRSLENRHQRLVELRDDVLRDPKLLEDAWRNRIDMPDSDDDLTEDERWQLEQNALRFTVARNIDELNHEIGQLEELIRLAVAAEQQQPERKLRELQSVMHELGVQDTGEKLLIFTEAKDTLDYLVENLTAWGFAVITIHGEMQQSEREAAEAAFKSESKQVMIATEAAGEGINLQFCHLMVNYDVPWNPTRLEQRLGRIHRYGQDREVFMFNLVANNTREGRVLEAVLLKLERMRAEMGTDRVYDVIGERFVNAQLETLIRDAVTNRRMFDDILASLDAALPEDTAEAINRASLQALATRYVDVAAMTSRRQEAKENRLTPAFIRAFFVSAFEALFPDRLEQRADGCWRVRHVPADLRNVPPELAAKYGQPASEYLRFTFDIEESKRTGVEFVGPGHALFEAISHMTLVQFGEDLEQGAVFLDPDNRREGLIWLIEATVNDGHGAVVGQQLFAIYQPADAAGFEALQPSVFLDFAIPEAPVHVLEAVRGLVNARGQVLGWSIQQLFMPYCQQVIERRAREIEIVRRYLRESFDVLIAKSDGLLMDYEHKQSTGKDMRVKIAEEERRNADLRRRKAERLARAEREALISLSEPRIVGVAAIIPHDGASKEQEMGESADMRRDDAIERAAIEYVMNYERQHHRQPEDLSELKLPYDIRSTDADGTIRYIEVKGRAGVGGVELSEREWLTAENLGEDYWLYIVADAKTNPTLSIIRDPAHRIPTDEIIKRTRYHIPADVWQNAEQD
ncbi:MAG: helicase-related protein [Candidatus Flexifilum sp.]